MTFSVPAPILTAPAKIQIQTDSETHTRSHILKAVRGFDVCWDLRFGFGGGRAVGRFKRSSCGSHFSLSANINESSTNHRRA